MPADVNKIAQFRAPEREGKTPEERSAKALEHIADVLEAMRQDFIGLQSMLATMDRKR